MLDELQARAETVDSCKCKLSDVVRARSWFHLSHQRSRSALNNIEGSSFAKKAAEGKGPLGIDYAWALLVDGNAERGLEVMSRAALQERHGSWMDRLRFGGAGEMVLRPLDLAYAQTAAGLGKSAIETLASRSAQWRCKSALAGGELHEANEPWQGLRDRALVDLARRKCPRGS